MPARIGSPDLRARTKSTSRRWCFAAGKPASRVNDSVAEPSEPVVASGGTLNCENGTAVAYTSAPLTVWPQVSVTTTFSENEVLLPRIGDGDATNELTWRRAGDEMSDADTLVPLAPVGQPVAAGAGAGAAAAVTTAVGTDVALVDPSTFVAVARTRSVFPWSTALRSYVVAVAPEMSE